MASLDTDATFDPSCAFGSRQWAATTLGLSADSFYRKRANLEQNGFPAIDPLLNQYLKADVLAWIESRRTVRENKDARDSLSSPMTQGANLDGI